EFAATEVGPQGRSEVELGVGELPEEKVTDSRFATGADQQVGIGQLMGIEILLNTRLIHIVRLQLSVLCLMQEFTHGVYDFCAAAIAEGDCEMKFVEMGSFLLGGPNPLKGRGRERVESADCA